MTEMLTGERITPITKKERRKIGIVSGSAHPELAEAIAAAMGTELDPVQREQFPNSELYPLIGESVRGKHAFLIQPHVRSGDRSVQDAIMELNLMIDAARMASAREITAVIPLLGYGRQDRRTDDRGPVGARVVLEQLKVAGADRIVTVDMHSQASQAGWGKPFDMLPALPILGRAIRTEMGFGEDGINPEGYMVVAPDRGAGKLVDNMSRYLGTHSLTMGKDRGPVNSGLVSYHEKYPEAEGFPCIIIDDMVDTGGTLVTAAEALLNSGAQSVSVAATHGLFSGPALERLQKAPIDKVIVTDTVPQDAAREALGDRLEVVSVASYLARGVLEICRNGSISRAIDEEMRR